MIAIAAGPAALVLACLLACFPARASALRSSEKYSSTPEQANMAYEDVAISTPDGLTLHGWFFPLQDQEGQAFHEPKPIVILVTDGTENMGSLLWHYYQFFRGAPWHVLMFDWRGTGTSSRWSIDSTRVVMPEQMVDLQAAIDFARDRPEFDGKHVGLFGYGAGAAVVIAVAAEREDIQAVIVRGIYTTQAELCARHRSMSGLKACVPHPGWPAEKEPIRAAPWIKAPVLVVVGENDAVTPPAMAQAVHDALTGPKQFWAAPKAGHEGRDSPEAAHLSPFRQKLHGFFGRYLGKD